MSPLDRPLFLVGTGRCGSTVLHEMLAHHERLSFLTHYLDRHPDRPRVNARLLGLREHTGLRQLLDWRVEPSEAWDYWDSLAPGFSRPCRDLVAADAGPRVQRRVRDALPSTMHRLDHRLLVKFTGWPRLEWILTCFPDARVVHVVRDARAVTNSLLAVDWWQGWRGPLGWSFGPLDREENELWERTRQDFAALGALQWNRLVRAWHASASRLDAGQRGQILEVRYDALCADRDGTLRRILDFAELPWTASFAARVARYELESRDDKWQRNLSPASQQAMGTVLDALRWREVYAESATFAAPRAVVSR